MRPIDANPFIKWVQECGKKCPTLSVEKLFNKLKDTQVIDPVRHGGWIKMSDRDGIYWACSECGEDIPRVSHFDPQFDLFPRLESIDKTNYCPNCGAKMDRSDNG